MTYKTKIKTRSCTSPCERWVVLQAQPTSAREGKGLVNCVYKPCPAALYSAVQSHCSILSHDALHHCLSSNSSLENGEGELGHHSLLQKL